MSTIKGIISNTTELGQIIRAQRKAAGETLQQASKKSDVGTRFLSELERGKQTAEIGKVISALDALGLNLAVIQKPTDYQLDHQTNNTINEKAATYNTKPEETLSEQLGLEFPYDWSNPHMNNTTFIHLVLAKTRFNDILRLSHHFGISRIENEISHFINTPQHSVIVKLISHIRAGIKIASAKNEKA